MKLVQIGSRIINIEQLAWATRPQENGPVFLHFLGGERDSVGSSLDTTEDDLEKAEANQLWEILRQRAKEDAEAPSAANLRQQEQSRVAMLGN